MKAKVELLEQLLGTDETLAILKMAKDKGLGPEHTHQALDALLDKLVPKTGTALVEGPAPVDDLTALLRYKAKPVSVREFIESKFYLGKGDEVYPVIMDDIIEINSGKYEEAVLTGGIGSGKTTIALYSQAYQLYLLSCLRDPHQLFGLDSSSEIKILFQNINLNLARGVDFARFKDMVSASPYFQRHFMFNPLINSKLIFPNRIEVEPVSGSETASIGQNVIGGIIDEINFMAVVKDSKNSTDGGTYDQAIELYNTIARRRKSRFMVGGHMPGLLCLVSSKRTPGQFTDKKEEEARTNPAIFVYNKRMWDIKPDSFTGEKFRVFTGDAVNKPRIILEGDTILPSEAGAIDHIPIEFISDFRDDITKALRDIAGKSTLAISPFMPDTAKVVANFGKRQNLCKQNRVDFTEVKMEIFPSLITHRHCRRFVHIDLALRGDSAGVVIGYVPKFVSMDRGAGTVERLPVIEIDLALEVVAPTGGEIEFANIRRLLYKLRELGMPIGWVTLDSYQSVDTMQILRSEGFITGYQSMDTTMVPYQMLKRALYDGRVPMATNPKLQNELVTLEHDLKRNKIDHNAHGCFIGSTEVECTDGETRTMEFLEFAYSTMGYEYEGWTWDSAINCTRAAMLRKPRLTKMVTRLSEILLSNGRKFTCTNDHRWMLETGDYREAASLQVGDSLKADDPLTVAKVTNVIYDNEIPVYDVTVEGTENFKLYDGPFVHNSKDIADALAGVVYGLTMRKVIWLEHGESPVGSPSVNREMENRVDRNPSEQRRSVSLDVRR